MKILNINSPQFKTKLIRKLKNLFPDCETEFVGDLERGIGFKLKDRHGRYRSNIVRIFRNSDDILERETLVQRIKAAGKPDFGFPVFPE